MPVEPGGEISSPRLGVREARKRLIVCCDGTWNDSISSDSPLTNVSRISRLIADTDGDGAPQVVYYHSGVGSGTSQLGNVVDGISGRGISANIRDAYSFICHNVSNQSVQQDEIVLIGFSRGAFTVRAIAALIEDIGLLTKSGLGYLGEIYGLWKVQKRPNTKGPLEKTCKRLERAGELRTGVKVKVCAVWDTVGSLGFPIPDPFPQKASKRLAHVNSRLCKNVDVSIQALALNERRKHFQATVWKADEDMGDRILKQCWFLGTHSDVGGGNKDTGLANIALVWMVAQLDKYIFFNRITLHDFTSRHISQQAETIVSHREFNISVNLSAAVGIPMDVGVGATAGASHTIYQSTKASIIRSKGKIQNSMKGVFVLAGSRRRKPRQYLMNEDGLYRNPKSSPAATNESVHFTVRVLLGLGYRTCGSLEKYATRIEDSKVTWALSRKSKTPTSIFLPEEHFSDSEREILEEWMIYESPISVNLSAGVPIPLALGAGAEVPITLQAGGKSDLPLSTILLPYLDEAHNPTISFPMSLTHSLASAEVGVIVDGIPVTSLSV